MQGFFAPQKFSFNSQLEQLVKWVEGCSKASEEQLDLRKNKILLKQCPGVCYLQQSGHDTEYNGDDPAS